MVLQLLSDIITALIMDVTRKHSLKFFFRQFMEQKNEMSCKNHRADLCKITLPLILVFLYATSWAPLDMFSRETVPLGNKNPGEGLEFDWNLVVYTEGPHPHVFCRIAVANIVFCPLP